MEFEDRKKARVASLKGLKDAMDERMAGRVKHPGLEEMAHEEPAPPMAQNPEDDEEMEGLDPRLVIIIHQKRRMQNPGSNGSVRG